MAERSEVTSLGLDRVRSPDVDEEILVAGPAGDVPEAHCRLVFQSDGGAWVSDLTAPFDELRRTYVQALTSAAVDRARDAGSPVVRIDVYEFSEAMQDSLTDLGFAPRGVADRVWEIRL